VIAGNGLVNRQGVKKNRNNLLEGRRRPSLKEMSFFDRTDLVQVRLVETALRW
jgi:hypothetical protein